MISKKIFPIIAILSITLLLSGCDYQFSKTFFNDIAGPDDTHPIELNLLNSGDTLIIPAYQTIHYAFDTHGLKVIGVHFTIGNRSMGDFTLGNGSFSINPSDFTPGIYTLKATIYTHSGTGSVADNFESEGYAAQREWVLLIDSRRVPTVSNAVFSRTPEGFLKISWEKCEQYNFYSYFLETPSGMRLSIHDRNQTSYVDSMFIGSGTATFYVQVLSEYGVVSSNWVNTTINESYPKISIERKGVDSLRVSWRNFKYKVKYKLFVENHFLYDKSTNLLATPSDTAIVIPQPGFGDWIDFTLQAYSYTETAQKKALYRTASYDTYYFGRYINSGITDFSYSKSDNVIYSSNNAYTYCHNMATMDIIKSIYYSSYGKNMNSCAMNSSKVALLSPYDLSIYDDKSLSTKIAMPLTRTLDYFNLCDNNIIVCASSAYGIEFIDVANKNIMASIKPPSYPVSNQWVSIATSLDARYTAVVNTGGIRVYEFSNKVITAKYSDNRSYSSCVFDKNNPYRLILTLTGSDVIEIRNATDFSLINTIKTGCNNIVLCNIDPQSGYLLTNTSDRVYIFNINTGKNIFSMRSTRQYPKLLNGYLFSNAGLCLNISEKLYE